MSSHRKNKGIPDTANKYRKTPVPNIKGRALLLSEKKKGLSFPTIED